MISNKPIIRNKFWDAMISNIKNNDYLNNNFSIVQHSGVNHYVSVDAKKYFERNQSLSGFTFELSVATNPDNTSASIPRLDLIFRGDQNGDFALLFNKIKSKFSSIFKITHTHTNADGRFKISIRRLKVVGQVFDVSAEAQALTNIFCEVSKFLAE